MACANDSRRYCAAADERRRRQSDVVCGALPSSVAVVSVHQVIRSSSFSMMRIKTLFFFCFFSNFFSFSDTEIVTSTMWRSLVQKIYFRYVVSGVFFEKIILLLLLLESLHVLQGSHCDCRRFATVWRKRSRSGVARRRRRRRLRSLYDSARCAARRCARVSEHTSIGVSFEFCFDSLIIYYMYHLQT